MLGVLPDPDPDLSGSVATPTSATLWKTREEFNQLHIDLDPCLNYYRDANLDDKIGPWEAWLNVLDKRTFDQNTMSLGAAANILR